MVKSNEGLQGGEDSSFVCVIAMGWDAVVMPCTFSALPKIFWGCCSGVLHGKLSKWGLENVSGVKLNEGRGESLAANSDLNKSMCTGKAIPFISRD